MVPRCGGGRTAGFETPDGGFVQLRGALEDNPETLYQLRI
jgi:hypothetical protein